MTEMGESAPKDPEADLRRDFTFSDEKKKSTRKPSGPRVSLGAAAVGGAIASELGRRGFNAGTEKLREVLGTSRPKERAKRQKGGAGGEKPPEVPPPTGGDEKGKEDPIHNASFAKVMSMSNDQSISEEERRKWVQEKNLRKDEFEKFDGGSFVADTEIHFQTIMRTSEWDAESGKGVYDRLNSYSEARDAEYNGRSNSDPRLKGLIGVAIRAEAARVVATGIAAKLGGLDAGDRKPWLKEKNYTDREVNRLAQLASENHIFDFATDAPKELVGASLKQGPTFDELLGNIPPEGLSVEEYRRQILGRRESFRDVPLYFGSVFKGGKNQVHVDREDIIPFLDLASEQARDEFILRNLYAFNYLFRKPESWKGAAEDWLNDEQIANLALSERVDTQTIEDFERKLRAMMAVTASARAMERSNGVAKDYLTTLVGANEKGEPNIDMQDTWDTFLLHNHPETLQLVLSDQRVLRYYKRILLDAGLVYDSDKEWTKVDGKWKPSELNWSRDAGTARDSSRLIEYLKGKAKEKGGIQGYIEEVLLAGDGSNENREVRMAAARLACDAFLVDKYTRWEWEVTAPERLNKEEKELRMQPLKNWGGDPLRSIIEPSFLPRRIKRVYQGEFEHFILDAFDHALRPQDYIDGIIDARNMVGRKKYEVEPGFGLMVPSMTTHLKAYARLSDATYGLIGTSMATDLGSFLPDTEEKLVKFGELLRQVYGDLKVKDAATGKDVLVGPSLIGAMMTEAIDVKARAITIQSARPDWSEIANNMIDPQRRDRPLLAVLQMLYGLDLRGRSGLYQKLKARLGIVFGRGNMFKDVKKIYYDTYDLLATNDQSGGHYSGIVNIGGVVIRVANAIGEMTGVVGGRH